MKNPIGRIIGVLHVPALPGSPRNELDFRAVIDWVLRDADALAGGGVEVLLLENFGDAPFYPARVPAHTVAFMTAIGREVRRAFNLPLGINVLRNDAESALAVASAASAEFIRVNIHTGARVTDQGLIQGTAHETLRYRKLLGCDVKIYADTDVKHSAPLAARPLADDVEEVISRGCADAVIVTGSGTGKETALEDLRIAKQAAGPTPVFAGSGVHARNVAAVLEIADGAIVGTAFKRDGITTNPVDRERVTALTKLISQSRLSDSSPTHPRAS
jgi:membrane complex biogenesis BtpA family protein